MVAFRRRVLVLILAAVCAGACASCTAAPAPSVSAPSASNRAVPSSSPASSSVSATPSTPTRTKSSTAARPTVSRKATTAPAPIPPVSALARADGLIDVRTIIPDAIIDLRYATSNNFVGVVLYPADARCLVHQSMAPGLTTAAAQLRSQGDLLVFWDCYRPHAVQVHMFEIVPDPDWVARPGPYATSHEAARSVDVTLAKAASNPACPAAQQVQHHCLLDMGTGFDDFTARAHAFATDGVSAQAQANRALLRAAMNAGGIVVYSGEWWHFDGPGSLVERPQLSAPVD
ncbi:M15 family metallopeptidase [Jatrophihabitans sp. DSM 45814]